MKHYDRTLKAHLADYARRRLGVHEAGEYDGRQYRHILPERLKCLNLIESIRAEVQDHLQQNRAVRLHKYFHHLNSSQALAFNLFFPFLTSGESAADLLCDALGVRRGVSGWWFERVHDKLDGTNVDVAWYGAEDAHVFCEVKLSEREFGVAPSDERHLEKRLKVYLPKLKGLVTDALLEEREFFQHYQLLRNVSLLCGDSGHQLVFIVPAENEALRPALERVMASLSSAGKPRVCVVYLESLVDLLLASTAGDPRLFVHATQLKEKYVPLMRGAG